MILDVIISHQHLIEFLFIFGGMLLLVKVELRFPQSLKNNIPNRRKANVVLAFLSLGFSFLFSGFFDGLIASLIKFIPESILIASQAKSQSTLISIAFPIVALDFFQYWVHRASHKFSFLWRFHAVHHSDIACDVTTSYRHHPFEIVFITILQVPFILFLFFVFHIPMISVVAFSGFNILISLSSHSNIKLPKSIDNHLRYWIVTPSFHRTHHVQGRRNTDSNYGGVFPWFDYLFRTSTKIKYNEMSAQKIGIGVSREGEISHLRKLLLFPFQYRCWVKKTKNRS